MPTSGDASKGPVPKSGTIESYNLLALDGGGVRGISSMIILKKIMDRVQEVEYERAVVKNKPFDHEERRPVDYFDLAAGTSTGGLIALMLFRLNMKCSEVIAQYDNLAEQVFSPKLGSIPLHQFGVLGKFVGDIWLKFKAFTGQSQFSHRPLEQVIDVVVAAFPLDEEDREKKGDAALVKESQGQMFMCATLADKGESILLRNYAPPFPPLPVTAGAQDLDFNTITIKEAARATSAAPTYLKEVDIQGLKFWDGGLLNNNPIDQVWDNRGDLVSREAKNPRIKCIVSLGTTHPEHESSIRPGRGISRFFNTITKTVAFATNTEAKHRDFDRNMRQHNRRRPEKQTAYFRFNAPTDHEQIDLGDYLRMPKLVQYTEEYLKRPEVDNLINECAEILAKRI
ncbi:hypothetical protein LTR47_004556 [Exophiala xenobiotica]|nr:hypothetical protein LTR41_000412 [Exophiala xenobiotica]KAK5234522.1 hypothetical protein LTR47_004556 [Exophiala xenobiotica]KAK5254157.1 hypothetical protein LTS06_001644 [Exophiala xenobiotica]KAK5331346.1 hypothetical protein LTR93_000349 [Exophiala xenobiotica]KAK5352118.1 hypothetical protein LTR61_004368 [Exophiala xenobiotica]